MLIVLHLSILLTSTVSGKELCRPLYKSIVGWLAPSKMGPASKRLAQTSRKNKLFWNTYSEVFQTSTKSYLEKRLDIYLKAKRLRNSHVLFLESLGIEFKSDKVIVPTLGQILDVLERTIDELKRQHNIPEDQIIRPKLFIKVKDVQSKEEFTFHVPFGTDVYRGHNVEDFAPIINAGVSVFSTEEFYLQLSKGDFILGSLDPIYLSNTDFSLNIFLHDLGHLSGFYRVPDYMQNMRMASGSILDVNQTEHFNRFFSTESAYFIKPVSDKELAKWLGLPQEMLVYPSLNQLKDFYGKLNSTQIKTLRKSILKSLFDHVSPLGGGTSDVMSAFEEINQFPLQKAYLPLQYMAEELSDFEGAWRAERELSNSDILAYFAHFVIVSKNLKPEDWAVLLRSRKGEEPEVFKEILYQIPSDLNHPLWIMHRMR